MSKKLNLSHLSLLKTYLISHYATFTSSQSLTSAQKTQIKNNIGVSDISQYIKSASVSNGVLTLTKQDGSTVQYSYDDSGILTRLDTAESAIANNSSRLSSLENTIASMQTIISSYSTRITELENKLSAITLEV